MKYPVILLLPVLMLLDYFGTLVGAVMIKKGYSDHFGMEHYEMNPVWQDSVAGSKWFNPRHLATTLAMTVGAIAILELTDHPTWLAHGFIGALLAIYALLVGRHLSNIITFRYVSLHPEEVSGTVHMAHPMLLTLSASQLAPVAIPLALIAALTTSAYVVGATIGIAGLFLSHSQWIRKARRTKPANAPETPER